MHTDACALRRALALRPSNGYINNLGQVVGTSIGASSPFDHAFLYSNAQMIDLGAFGTFSESVGLSINDLGQVVGSSETMTYLGPLRAFLYSNGQMMDLNNLIDSALGVTLSQATDINDKGQIVANGTNGRAFLLTPVTVPEPGTLALVGGTLLMLIAWVSTSRRNPAG